MGKVRSRSGGKYLFFDFYYQGVRCREQTKLPDTRENRKNMMALLERIEAEIVLNTFDYAKYFTNSPMVNVFTDRAKAAKGSLPKDVCPLMVDFAWEWFGENELRWKRSYKEGVKIILKNYLVPVFGEMKVNCITKSDVLKFRSTLAKAQDGKKVLSPDRINHIITPLRMMLEDAADRFDFITPFRGFKQLAVAPTQVDPFTLEEVDKFLGVVRPDFRNYYQVRFLTGMRTAEIDGLKWEYVDFGRREILIRETLVKGYEEKTKNFSSARSIAMSKPVYDALKSEFKVTANLESGYVFCTRNGKPLDYTNVANRVWYPTLKKLGLKKRRPYQTRHTAATLWLASGENPEWIARQMGHTTTKMLFTVYSRFVPNLTRQDGSVFELLLAAKLKGGGEDE